MAQPEEKGFFENIWYHLSGEAEKDRLKEKKRKSMAAANFVRDYYLSEGFKQRLENAKPILEEEARRLDNYLFDASDENYVIKPTSFKVPINFSTDKESSYYSSKENKVVINDADYDKDYPSYDEGATTAHEFGHVVDDHVKINRKYKYLTKESPTIYDYSQLYPIFKNSKEYKKLYYMLFDNDEGRDTLERYPNTYYSLAHDAMPTESYADLMALREGLYRHGIYDSTKKDNVFTKEHLDKWKALNKHLRIFDNFSDEDIIRMINEVAYNKNNSNRNSLEDINFA